MHPAGRTETIWIHPKWKKKAELKTSDTNWMNLIDKNEEQRLHRHLNATNDDSVKTLLEYLLLWSVKIWPKENHVTETGRVLTANIAWGFTKKKKKQTRSSMLHLDLQTLHHPLEWLQNEHQQARHAQMLKKTTGQPLLCNILNTETELINSSVQRCYAGHRVTVLTTQLNYFSETLNMWTSRSRRMTVKGKLCPVYFI